MNSYLLRRWASISCLLSIRALFLAVLLVMGACATAPTMRDVAELDQDKPITYGNAAVFVGSEKQKLGLTWSGESHFYLLILPSNSNEAISYDLDKDGAFYWALPPGEYLLLGYHWQRGTEKRSGRIGATFTVPGEPRDRYIGSFEFHQRKYSLDMHLADNFDQASAAYELKFPIRKGRSVKQLIQMPSAEGNADSIRGQCHESWKIACNDRFSGITPISPAVKSSGFPVTKTQSPTFSWRPSANPAVSYDLIVYEAASYTTSGIMTSYMTGRKVIYQEGLTQPSWPMQNPLKPNTRYYWSVRLREGNTVSWWSTQSHFSFMILAVSSGSGQWFQFQTP